jgi:RNA polymerase sigma-70 factor, ECF subfamily
LSKVFAKPVPPAAAPARVARALAPVTASRRAEAKLITAARRGDAKALTQVVELAAGPASRFSRAFCRDPHDAEDLAQDVLATLLRSLDSFRGDSSLSTWTYIVAKRACSRLRQRSARQAPLAADDARLVHLADPAAGPQRRLERRQLGEALERAIAALPVAQREVLVLRDVEGLPASEVGEVLGLGERAVKSRLHRARLALRAQLAPFVGAADAPPPAASCPDTAHMLSRYVEGELNPAVCARMEEHVRACPSCGDACHSLREVLGACRAYGERPLTADVRKAVKQAVKAVLAVRRT